MQLSHRLLFSVVLLLGSLVCAQEVSPYSIGATLGDPTGLNGKMILDEDHAVDFGFGYGFGARSGMLMYSDYLWIHKGQVVAGDSELDLYYGVGGRLVTISSGDQKGRVGVGARAPVGLIHHLPDSPIEFFGETAFCLDVAPSMSADLDLAAGFRYQF